MLHPEIEMLDREGILRIQRRRLATLGERLAKNDAWRDHFNSVGMQPEDLSAPDGLENAPFLEKADLRGHYPFPFLTAPMEEVERFVATSGTTGLPVLFGMTQHDFGTLLPNQVARLLAAAGVKRASRSYQGYGNACGSGGRRWIRGSRRWIAPIFRSAPAEVSWPPAGCSITVMTWPRCRPCG